MLTPLTGTLGPLGRARGGGLRAPTDFASLRAWWPGATGTATTWPDSSGHGYTLTGTATVLGTGGPASQPALRFNGSSQSMQISSLLGLAAGAGRTVILVERLAGSLSTRAPAFAQGQSGSGANYWALEANTPSTAGNQFNFYCQSTTRNTATATTAAWLLHALRQTSMPPGGTITATSTYYVNGSTSALTGSGTYSSFAAADTTALARFPGLAIFGQVDIADCSVYDDTLTLADLTDLFTYYNSLYQLY